MALQSLRSPRGSQTSCRQSPLLGFHSLFATQAGGVHLPRGFPSPGTFRPQVFSTSRRFAPLPTLRPCFMPLPRPGFRPPGVFPPRQQAGLIGQPCPPDVGAHLVHHNRRRSWHRSDCSPSGLSSACGVRLPCAVVRPLQGPVPLMGFWASPGFSLLLPWRRLPVSSAHALDRRARSPKEAVPWAGLQRLVGQEVRLASFESCRPA